MQKSKADQQSNKEGCQENTKDTFSVFMGKITITIVMRYKCAVSYFELLVMIASIMILQQNHRNNICYFSSNVANVQWNATLL